MIDNCLQQRNNTFADTLYHGCESVVFAVIEDNSM